MPKNHIVLSDSWPEAIRQWKEHIEFWAEQYVVDPNLIAAIISVESGGWYNAVSHSGACGLMQVMARDSATVRPEIFLNRPTCNELLDPKFNIGQGTHILVWNYEVYGHDWREALKHYGPLDVGYTYADNVIRLWHRNSPSSD